MDIKPTKKLMIKDWKENVVQLVQYPRARCCPNISPFSLKVETFLRLFGIEYRNVNNEFKHGSIKGQVPFIELNGRQHADSNNIIDVLKKEFDLQIDNLSPKQKSDARAYTIMLEQSFFPAIMYMRSIDPKWMFTDEQGVLGNITGAKKVLIKTLAPMKIKSYLKKRLHSHGIGRNTVSEVEEIMKNDLRALSNLLSDKQYFFGDQINSFDVTVFAHLAMLFNCPQPSDDILNFVDSKTTNLKTFYENLKEKAWGTHWDHVCQTLELNPKTSAELAAEVNQAVAEENFERAEQQAP